MADLKRCLRNTARASTLATAMLGGCTVHHMFTDSHVTRVIAHTSLMCIWTTTCALSAVVWYVCDNYTIGMDMVVGMGDGGGPPPIVVDQPDPVDPQKMAVAAMGTVIRNTVLPRGEDDNQCLICFEDPRADLCVDIRPVEGEQRVRLDVRSDPCFRCPRCRCIMHTRCVTEMVLIGGRTCCPLCTYPFGRRLPPSAKP